MLPYLCVVEVLEVALINDQNGEFCDPKKTITGKCKGVSLGTGGIVPREDLKYYQKIVIRRPNNKFLLKIGIYEMKYYQNGKRRTQIAMEVVKEPLKMTKSLPWDR